MKDFLLLTNINVITYKGFFPLLKEGRVMAGYTFNKTLMFETPKGELKQMIGISWFTTLSVSDKQPLKLTKTYDPELYPKYDNYNAIEVSRVKDIPYDYDGVMGVPITFLYKYNPTQFEIVGITENADYLKSLYIEGCKKYDRPYVNGKRGYSRLLIKRVSYLNLTEKENIQGY